MVMHMKTTVEISDPILSKAKAFAHKEKTTIRALVEEGLRKVLDERSLHRPFKLKDASFKGEGFQDEFKNASWEKIRDAVYEERGA